MSSPKVESDSGRLPLPGVALIKEFEGCYLNAYPDPLTSGKPITIGWGSTKKRDGRVWKMGDRISQKEADELLIYQLEHHYLPCLEKIPGWSELNENQQGALLSFAWNLGASFFGAEGFDSISKMLRDAARQPALYRNWSKAVEVFSKYCNPGSNVEEGLRRRRVAEAKLFTSAIL